MFSPPQIYALSESVLVCQFDGPARFPVQQLCWAIAAQCRALAWVDEVVPGMNNVSLQLNPLKTDVLSKVDDFRVLVDKLIDQCAIKAIDETSTRCIEIPVRYGGEWGPDLSHVAQTHNLSEREVVEQHTGSEYRVYFLGFQPGFAYLGGLPSTLATPRRADPRLAVPAGSVGIGGAQTGIYPAQSPGGWQLIGRTELALFDLQRSPPGLLQSGDRVRFVAMKDGLC